MEIILPKLSFFLVAVPAVLISGIGKGGLGSVLGVMAVPLMALVISPVQAAAILLPLLLVMDACATWGWRHYINWQIIRVILPAGIVGVFLGFIIFYQLSEDAMRFLIGLIAVAFCLKQWAGKQRNLEKPGFKKGVFWATVSGFTSFGVHAGSAPLSVYMLPLRLDKKTLAGTMAIFFGIINLIKMPAYGGLGQFSQDNLFLSAVLLPLCPVGVALGKKLVHKIREALFYRLLYIGLFVTGIKLIFDAVV